MSTPQTQRAPSPAPGAARSALEIAGALRSALEIADALGQLPPTPEQVAVIEAPLEPTLVVAGAGSGKTETMASLGERIGRRLRTATERGLWTPEENEELPLPVVSTYHAYAGRLVSEHGLRWGIEPHSRLLSEASS